MNTIEYIRFVQKMKTSRFVENELKQHMSDTAYMAIQKVYDRPIKEVFTQGFCYWFAYILNQKYKGNIQYLPLDNHYVFFDYISDRYYDITGNVSESVLQKPCVNWDDYRKLDIVHAKRLQNNCIDKVDGI